MDLLEIPKKGHLLVVVDYYSKWPEIAFLTKTDAGTVIKCLQSMFCLKPSEVIMAHRLLHENLKDSLSI